MSKCHIVGNHMSRLIYFTLISEASYSPTKSSPSLSSQAQAEAAINDICVITDSDQSTSAIDHILKVFNRLFILH